MKYFLCFFVLCGAFCIIIRAIRARPSAAERNWARDLRDREWREELREFKARVDLATAHFPAELDQFRALELLDAMEASNAKALMRDRIHYLEQLARKGDLIAYQEWKLLTGNHDGVYIGELD